MKCRFVLTHTVHQTEIIALLDNWVTNIPSVKMLYSQKKIICTYIFIKHNILVRWPIENQSSFLCLKLCICGL
jgi:hypothetical protein